MNIKLLAAIIFSIFLFSCNDTKPATQEVEIAQTPTFINKAQELTYDMIQKVGDYEMLKDRNDVVYTYTYTTPDGKSDVSTEKYIFDGELSYGQYQKHERTLADLEGTITQGWDGNKYWLKHNGEIMDDETMMKRVAFNRPTNFYWFTMFQKLMDPGLNYDYLGEKTIDDKPYEVVKISFDSTPEKPTDIYQLYINKETSLVDQFLFTVADFGKMDIPLLMKIEYETVDGIMIPTQRKYKQSTWDAEVSDAPWINVTWSDIKFDNGLTKADFTM